MGLLRLLLAVAVVAGHTAPIFGLPLLPAGRAVQVFFVISGFYMAMVLVDKYPTVRAIPAFYLNRFARLYPTYLVVMLATWARFLGAWVWLGHPPTMSFWIPAYAHMAWLPKSLLIFSNWTMLGLDVPSLFHFDPARGFLLFDSHTFTPFAPDGTLWLRSVLTVDIAWTIGLECWFYLLVPALIRLPTVAVLAIGLASAGLRLLMISHGLVIYYVFPAQLCFFIGGLLAERLWRTQAWRLPPGRYRPALLAGLVVLIAFCPWGTVPGRAWVYYGLVALALPGVFALSRSSRWDRWIGNLSYPLYLVHPLIVTLVANLLGRPNPYVVLAVSLAISVALLHWVDTPIDRWRQRRAARLAPVPAPA